MDYQSFDNASELFRAAPPFGTPFRPPFLSLVTVPLRCGRACACVFHAAANYLLRRSMNSTRNYISSDIQLEAEGRGGAIRGRRRKKVHTGRSKAVEAREKPCRGSWWSPPPPPVPPPARQTPRDDLPASRDSRLFLLVPGGRGWIFRNPDNVPRLGAWMRSRDCKPSETIPSVDSSRFVGIGTRVHVCVSYVSRF